MSDLHPIVAVTGSSGAGTSSVKSAFEHIFQRESIAPALVEGDSFHRYDRSTMDWEVEKAALQGKTLTHFGPDGNLLGEQWNIARHVDLLIGVVPIINLEWIQKIQRDRTVRGYSAEAAIQMILLRMPDYVNYICPQFSRTDINFQRVPTIDTSNPFTHDQIPTNDESMVVVHVIKRNKLTPDYRLLLQMLPGAFMSRLDTIVVPASKMVLAMELMLTPVIERLMAARDRARQNSPS